MQKFIIFLIFIIISRNSLASDEKIFENIENYLNNIHNLKANFKQLDNNGNNSEGVITFQKPFNFKIETKYPKSIIIGNKSLVIYHDYKLNQTSHTRPDNSLINILLKDNIKLDGQNIIIKKLDIGHHNIEVEVQAKSNEKDNSSLILIFDKVDSKKSDQNLIELRQIAIQRDRELTSLILENTKINIKLDDNEFIFEYSKKKKINRR